MAQHDYVIDNGPGLGVRVDLNALFMAIVSQNAGPVQPYNPYPYMLWLDTSAAPPVVRQRRADNAAWEDPSIGVNMVKKTGDTMSGDLYIRKVQPYIFLQKTAASHNLIAGYLNNAPRWLLSLGTDTGEGGANTGSDFALYRYSDAGTYLGTALHIPRANGVLNVPTGIILPDVDPPADLYATTKKYVERRASEWGAYHADARVLKTGDLMTGRLVINAPSGYNGVGYGQWAVGSCAFEIRGEGATDCLMSFHRPGTAWYGGFGLNMGMKNDNGFYLGGWSHGDWWRFVSDSSGNFTAKGNVGAYSDIRDKEDISTIEQPLDLIRRMRGVRYTRKSNKVKGVGVIAQEIQPVVPEVVNETTDGELSVAYGNLAGVFIEGIKSLMTHIETLTAKVETLTARVAELEAHP